MVKSRSEVNKCLSEPVSLSFLLLRYQFGIPIKDGFFIAVSMSLTSFSVKKPILILELMFNVCSITFDTLFSTPFILLSVIISFLLHSISLHAILRICLYSDVDNR